MSKIKLKHIIITFLLLFFQGSVSLAGEPAPNVLLKLINGDTLQIEDLKGKVVYLDFWATWCAPCRKSLPWMEQMHTRYADKGLKIIAVSIDNKQHLIERYLQRFKINFDIAHDPLGVASKTYDVQVMPSSFLISKDGEILLIHKGFNDVDGAMLEKEFQKALNVE